MKLNIFNEESSVESLNVKSIAFTADSHFSHGNIIRYCKRPFLNKEEQIAYDRYHKDNATGLDKKPWETLRMSKPSVRDHDETLISNWNRVVPEDGVVFHLGDFAYLKKPAHFHKLIDQLNGKIYFVYGNHDRMLRKHNEIQRRFKKVKEYMEIEIDGTFICLFHYAMRTWNRSHHGSWSLFGHTHNMLEDGLDVKSMDVGVDAIAHLNKPQVPSKEEYRPILFEEIKEII